MNNIQNSDNEKYVKHRNFIAKFLYFAIFFLISVFVVRYALPALMPFFIAFVVSTVLRPAVLFLHRKCRFNTRFVSVLAVVLFYSTIGVLIVILVIRAGMWLGKGIQIVPQFYKDTVAPTLQSVTDSLNRILSNAFPEKAEQIAQYVNADRLISEIGSALVSMSGKIASHVGNFAISIPSAMLSVIITVISTLFALSDYEKIRDFARAQCSPRLREIIRSSLSHTGRFFKKFIFSYALIMLITFVELLVGFLIIGINHAVSIAAVIAVLDILPVIGSGLILVPWALISLITGNVGVGVGLLVLWCVLTVIRNIIEPKIVGSNVGMHPLLTLFAMLAGNFIYGAWGIILLPVGINICQHLNDTGLVKFYNKPEPTGDGSDDDGKIADVIGNACKKTKNAIKNKIEHKKHVSPEASCDETQNEMPPKHDFRDDSKPEPGNGKNDADDDKNENDEK